MTPFDGAALVAMLIAFYPAVSVAALNQARRERPEYFAAGELFGTHGEKMRLPDGRVFDLIFDVDGPRRRWQAIDVTNAPDAPPESFPLEPGPLLPIDADIIVPPPLEPTFREFAAGDLAGIEGAGAALELRYNEIAAETDPRGIEGAFADTAEQAIRDYGGLVAGAEQLNAADGINAANGLTEHVHDAQADHPDPDAVAPPNDLPNPEPPNDPPIDGPDGVHWY